MYQTGESNFKYPVTYVYISFYIQADYIATTPANTEYLYNIYAEVV